MSRYVETLVGEDDFILIEVSDEVALSLTQGDVVKASLSLDEVSERAKGAFNRVLETTRQIASESSRVLRKLTDPPDEIELCFGLKLDANAGTLLTRAGTEAQFEVTLTWKKDKREKVDE